LTLFLIDAVKSVGCSGLGKGIAGSASRLVPPISDLSLY
jgi:hypothetical protein